MPSFRKIEVLVLLQVLRMLLNHVGEERFLKGVSLYLKKKLYGNSVTNDLWEGIGTATGALVRHESTLNPFKCLYQAST
jgi:aminopeptidase N